MEEVSRELIKNTHKKSFFHIRSDPYKFIQLDLLDLSPFKFYNKRFSYLINVIDVYSRYVWSYPLKKKSDFQDIFPEIVKNFKKLPERIYSDQDTVFQTKLIRDLLKEKNIEWIKISDNKGALSVIERFNRTMRQKLFQKIVEDDLQNEKMINNWIDHYMDVIKEYNNTIHSTTKLTPNQIYNNEKKWVDKREDKKTNIKNFDLVRVKNDLSKFDKKSFNELWSRNIYLVINREGYRYNLMNVENGDLLEDIKPGDIQIIKTADNIKLKKESNIQKLKNENKQQRFLKKEGLI